MPLVPGWFPWRRGEGLSPVFRAETCQEIYDTFIGKTGALIFALVPAPALPERRGGPIPARALKRPIY